MNADRIRADTQHPSFIIRNEADRCQPFAILQIRGLLTPYLNLELMLLYLPRFAGVLYELGLQPAWNAGIPITGRRKPKFADRFFYRRIPVLPALPHGAFALSISRQRQLAFPNIALLTNRRRITELVSLGKALLSTSVIPLYRIHFTIVLNSRIHVPTSLICISTQIAAARFL